MSLSMHEASAATFKRMLPALAAFLQAIAGNLVLAGLRLIPLGQTDGQRVLAGLEPVIALCAQRALVCPPRGQIGPITPEQRTELMKTSVVAGVYENAVDRESAYELLKGRAGQAPAPGAPVPPGRRPRIAHDRCRGAGPPRAR